MVFPILLITITLLCIRVVNSLLTTFELMNAISPPRKPFAICIVSTILSLKAGLRPRSHICSFYSQETDSFQNNLNNKTDTGAKRSRLPHYPSRQGRSSKVGMKTLLKYLSTYILIRSFYAKVFGMACG